MKEEDIKKSINSVTVDEETKKRIYKNVLARAESFERKKSKSRFSFKRAMRYALPLAACFCIMLFGSVFIFGGNDTPDGPIVHRGNPIGIMVGPSGFEAMGISAKAPDCAENVEYSVIDEKIAAIAFDVDGKTFYLRASNQSGDFSGVNGKVLFTESFYSQKDGVLYTLQSATGVIFKAHWTDGKTNFYLTSFGEISKEDFIKVCIDTAA